MRAAPGIDVRSGGNTLIGNVVHDNEDSGIQIFGSGGNPSPNNLVVNNLCYDNGDHGIDVSSAGSQRIIGNDVYRNATSGINVEGPSGGTTLSNNISVDNAIGSTGTKGNIRVDPASVAGTTLDYDLVYLEHAGSDDRLELRELQHARRVRCGHRPGGARPRGGPAVDRARGRQLPLGRGVTGDRRGRFRGGRRLGHGHRRAIAGGQPAGGRHGRRPPDVRRHRRVRAPAVRQRDQGRRRGLRRVRHRHRGVRPAGLQRRRSELHGAVHVGLFDVHGLSRVRQRDQGSRRGLRRRRPRGIELREPGPVLDRRWSRVHARLPLRHRRLLVRGQYRSRRLRRGVRRDEPGGTDVRQPGVGRRDAELPDRLRGLRHLRLQHLRRRDAARRRGMRRRQPGRRDLRQSRVLRGHADVLGVVRAGLRELLELLGRNALRRPGEPGMLECRPGDGGRPVLHDQRRRGQGRRRRHGDRRVGNVFGVREDR